MRILLYKLIGLAILIGSFLFGWQLMGYQRFNEAVLPVEEGGEVLYVKPGSSLAAIARELEQRQLISDARYLRWMGRWQGVAAGIKAGEYLIMPGTTPEALLAMMVAGDVRQYSLTIVEGWTFQQMRQAVAGSEFLSHTLPAEADGSLIMERLGKAGEHPEGRFFPDTYLFPRGMSDIDFYRNAYRAMETRLAREWADRAEGLPLKTPYEALTLASIVEKETAAPEERPAIAGVFVRRLQKGMRLQTDPTIIYGLGDSFDGNLKRRHLRDADNPYNTYRHGGLPPTPIALPGGEAIHAVLHPAEGDELYFVARGDGSGTHVFSSTLEQHNEAVIEHQLKGRRKPFSSYSN